MSKLKKELTDSNMNFTKKEGQKKLQKKLEKKQ